MHIFVEIWYMDHVLNIKKNEAIKILRPESYWKEFTVLNFGGKNQNIIANKLLI